MIIIRLASAFAIVVTTVTPAVAQSVLFESTLSNALRQRPANRRCIGCEERPGTVHLIADSQNNSGLHIALESLVRYLQAVGPNRKIGKRIGAVR